MHTYKGEDIIKYIGMKNAVSFLKMLDDCGIPNEFKQKECYKRIEKLVGKHTYTVHLPIGYK